MEQWPKGKSFALILAIIIGTVISAPQSRASEDKSQHIADLEARAARGFTSKQVELGQAYLTGQGVPQDVNRAAYWYEKAAKAGDPIAENELGYLYERGIGVKLDPKRSVHWYQLASASGLQWAKVNLAICYLKGRGVPKNPSTARQLLREAVEKGEGLAAAYLGEIEMFGLDGPVNLEAAERWFDTGVRLQDPVAAYNLAYIYTGSRTRSQDFLKGVRLLRSSAGKGYVMAIHSLGLLLVNHPELSQADGEGRELLVQSSAAGQWRSSAILAVLARDGRGTPQDANAAFYYFHLARLQGGEQGAHAVARDLEVLSQRLSPDVQAAMAGQAEEWFRQHGAAGPAVFLERDGHTKASMPLADSPAM